MIKYIEQDILESKCDFIIQQCNCITVKSLGLTKAISDKYLYANVYSKRRKEGNRNLSIKSDRDIPGTYKLFTDPSYKTPTIVALFSQWRPGKVNSSYFNKYPEPDPYVCETKDQRLKWFRMSLYSFGDYVYDLILKNNYPNKIKISIPFKIGCGLAGGEWSKYKEIIESFSTYYQNIIEVTICIKK